MLGRIFGENIELGRNEKYIFYKNEFTVSATKWALDKWKLKNIAAIYAEEIIAGSLTWELFDIEEQSPDRSYLLIDTDDNSIIHENKNYEALLYHIDFLGIGKMYDDSEK